ncbi:hypothetical protein CO174_03445 [Candidatus Uhrbacteria bacterium CG_4_9_14_3_um_filter_50_9]|uniref:Apea-like HEPN domain-containing protein n=1 Tax=Candidatus Uhrbacteria bacterium CG_4_9_14_3_um_filter_50_9 TaxID=1975035 RepID=A0A2M7XBZ7_9BACT|nr:MAG: hypothetical protein CO174_03445 [Candidatus Uhrbacteria bacterium CG_4_9_14_3_um_filter_50_9]
MSHLKEIYNLEFPHYITKLNLDGYLFKRRDDYKQQLLKLQHFVDVSGSEFHILPNTGEHAVTATVEYIEDKPAILEWGHDGSTRLDDILLLLDLFTGRSVFYKNWGDDEDPPIIRDSRLSQWGSQLLLSTRRETAYVNIDSTQMIDEATFRKMKFPEQADYRSCDIGFEKSLNNILALIASPSWQTEHKQGYFLHLYKNATKRSIIEYSFLSHWTIWEHLYAIHNDHLNERTLQTTDATDKVVFIIEKYFSIPISSAARSEIIRIKKARHTLSHFGRIPTNVDISEMKLFIRLAEQIIANILGLRPSNAFNFRSTYSVF